MLHVGDLSGVLSGVCTKGHHTRSVRAQSDLGDALIGVVVRLLAGRAVADMAKVVNPEDPLDALVDIQNAIQNGKQMLACSDFDALVAAGYTLASRAGPEDRARWASVRGSGVALWGDRSSKGRPRVMRPRRVSVTQPLPTNAVPWRHPAPTSPPPHSARSIPVPRGHGSRPP